MSTRKRSIGAWLAVAAVVGWFGVPAKGRADGFGEDEDAPKKTRAKPPKKKAPPAEKKATAAKKKAVAPKREAAYTKEWASAFAEAFKGAVNQTERATIRSVLVTFGKDVIPVVRPFSGDSDWKVSINFAIALIRLGDKDGGKVAIRLLREEGDTTPRAAAAWYLAKYRVAGADAALREIAKSDGDATMRKLAKRARKAFKGKPASKPEVIASTPCERTWVVKNFEKLRELVETKEENAAERYREMGREHCAGGGASGKAPPEK